MDQTITLKLEEFGKALFKFNEILNLDLGNNEVKRDASIKRFEYCFELSWKTSKKILDEIFGVNVNSPKTVFRELLKNQILSDKQTEYFLEMSDQRNLTTHTYNEKFIKELYKKLPNYLSEMTNLFDKLSQTNND